MHEVIKIKVEIKYDFILITLIIIHQPNAIIQVSKIIAVQAVEDRRVARG
jgi:hypothetical protein